MYSVYDYTTRLYTYYEATGPGGTHATAPPRPLFKSPIGATPEGAAWRLPFGAKKVGTGLMPKGRVANSGLALGGMGEVDLSTPTGLAVAAAAVYLAWRILR